MFELTLLGRTQATRAGSPVQIGSRKALALLVYLAVQGGTTHRETLAGLLWPEQDQARALAGLRQALYVLRRGIAKDLLEGDRQSLRVVDDELWIDVSAFESLTSATSSVIDEHGFEDEPARLERAAALYHGDFMDGFSLSDCPEFDAWQSIRAETYRRRFKDVLRALVGRYAEERKLERAIDHGRSLLLLDPYDQAEHRRLMVLNALADHQAAALRQHETLAKLLHDELGIEPDDETTELYEAVKRREVQLLLRRVTAGAPLSELTHLLVEKLHVREHAALPPSTERAKSNLPTQATAFVGRQRDLDELGDLLADPAARLITIVAPGGMGKTRLALALAEWQLELGTFGDGVFFVPLTSVHGVASLAQAVAVALGVKLLGREDADRQLVRQVSGRSLLLVLDNFEHALSGVGLVSELLAHAPDLKVLVTSRERLNVREEWFYQLWGMGVPDAEHDVGDLRTFSAIELFERCAKKANPRFDLGQNGADVVRICRQLQGMPLGIELAAAWVTTIPCKGIADEIDEDLGFLESRDLAVADRQRSLEAIFEYTWSRAGDAARSAFQMLSVFRGGFTRRAAEQVAGATLPILASLADMALIRLRDSGRYDIHELLRQFAEAKLRSRPMAYEEAVQAHARHFAQMLATLEPELKSARQFEALDTIAADVDNVLTSWQFAFSRRDVEAIEKMVMGFYFYCEMRGLTQMGNDVFQRGIDAVNGRGFVDERTSATVAKLLVGQGILRMRMGLDCTKSRRLSASLLAPLAVHDPPGYIHAVNWLATALPYEGQHGEAEALLDRADTFARGADDAFSVAWLLQTRGHNLYIAGKFLEAEPIFDACLTAFDACGDRKFKALGLNNWARTAMEMGAYERAASLNAEGLTIRRLANDPLGEAASLIVLGRLKTRLGEYPLAKRHLEEAARLMRQSMNYQYWGMLELDELQLDIELQQHRRARERFEQSRPKSDRSNPYYVVQRLIGAASLSYLDHDYATARSLLDRSLAMNDQLGHLHNEARALFQLGLVDLAEGSNGSAKANFRGSLDICRATGAAPLALAVLEGWSAFESGKKKLALLTLVHRDGRATQHVREAARKELFELAPTDPANLGLTDLWHVVADLT